MQGGPRFDGGGQLQLLAKGCNVVVGEKVRFAIVFSLLFSLLSLVTKSIDDAHILLVV